MNKAGGDARALATMLEKIGGATEPGMKILMDHPETKARVAAINKSAAAVSPRPFSKRANGPHSRRSAQGHDHGATSLPR